MATRYVRVGASGANNGTDWTNAYTTLTGATKSRGDLLYVAAGSYGTGTTTLNTALSGTTVIEIRKATVADHGTSTGWDDSYASGQATFGRFDIQTGYWTIDGATGGGPGSWTSGHGFKMSSTTAEPIIDMVNATVENNITLKHLELAGNLNATGGGAVAQDGVAVQQNGLKNNANHLYQYLYIHDTGRCPFFFFSVSNCVIEYCSTDIYNWAEAQHSELMSTLTLGDITFRYNLVTFCRGTGGLMWDNSTSHAHTLRVYGNVFYRASSDTRWDFFNGLIGGWTGGGGEDCYTMRIYHNTFINIGSATSNEVFGINNMVRFGDNIVQNNLFVDDASITYGNPITSHDYNRYINSGGTHSEANGTSAASGDPFVDKAGLDFRLTANTTSGNTLSSPYDVDMFGNTRTTWTRGAIEFTEGGGGPSSAMIISNTGLWL